MQIRAIESFLVLYRERNFSRASRRLFITQQGLSRQILSMEKELGQPLFERSRMGAEPTEAAHRLYPYYRQIAEIYRASAAVLQSGPEQRPVLRAGFAYGISSGGGPEFLIAFQKLHPEVELEIQEWSKEQCIHKLLHNLLDIAFLINPFPENLFRAQILTGDHMYVAMHRTHPLANSGEPLDFRLLEHETMITGSPENAMRQLFDYCCALTRIQPRIQVASSHNLDFVNAMRENVGLATLNSYMALRIVNPEIHIRQLILPCAGYLYGCIQTYNAGNSLAEQLLEFTRDYYIQHPLPLYTGPKEPAADT